MEVRLRLLCGGYCLCCIGYRETILNWPETAVEEGFILDAISFLAYFLTGKLVDLSGNLDATASSSRRTAQLDSLLEWLHYLPIMPNAPWSSNVLSRQFNHIFSEPSRQQGQYVPVSIHHTANFVVYVGLVLASIFAFTLACLSLDWPLINDGPLMHYVAWLMHQGAVPYRDIFDMNFPGTYIVHWLILCIPGNIDLIWRIFDLVLLTSTLLLMIKLMPPKAYWSAYGACTAFTLFYVGLGIRFIGERDMVMLPLEMGGVLCLVRFFEDKQLSFWKVFAAGMLFGAASTIKPFGLIMLIAETGLLTIILFMRGHSWKTVAIAWCMAIAGFVVPVASVLLWLYVVGGLADFLDILSNYIIPIYSQCNAENRRGLHCLGLLKDHHIPLVLIVTLFLTAYMVYSRRHDARFAIVAVAFLASIAHYALQGKGWPYHVIPAAGFGMLLCFWIFHESLLQHNIARWCTCACLAALIIFSLSVKAGAYVRTTVVIGDDRHRQVEHVAKYLRERIAPSDTVQVLDTG